MLNKKNIFFGLLIILIINSFNIFGMNEKLTITEFGQIYGNEISTNTFSVKNLQLLLESINDIKVEENSDDEDLKNILVSEIKEQLTQKGQFKLENEEYLKNKEWIEKNTKQCPKCGIHIEKNGGCRAIHCQYKECNTHFCWNCMNITGFHTDDHNCKNVPKGQERNVGYVINSIGVKTV